ncbi:hypothetical protein GGQ92_002835 [Gracilibacillus halotolerans]|uniref:Uncharacterized protein n=1 Tax=Gracilibacillus halotolerans TaxID=74386 RepID=A0A841RSV3_9BACI|nr:hypothetical protein [Gracilibacillus halotolerans]
MKINKLNQFKHTVTIVKNFYQIIDRDEIEKR